MTTAGQAAGLLAAEMILCRADPLRFVLFAFPWGTGELANHRGPRTWQREVLVLIGQQLRDGNSRAAAIRLAVASGNGVGKSALVSWLTLWALSTREDSRVVVTANTGKQLENKTWPELLTWHRRLINAGWFVPTATALASADPAHTRTWRADAIPWSETNTEAFAGLHNQGRRIVLIFDEASGIDDRIWDTAEGALTDTDTEILWLAFGNYTRNVGRFHECFGKFAHRWNARHIDSRTVEGVNQAQIAQWLADYGEDHDFFRMRVTGQCPRVGTVQFISSLVVAEARKRVMPDVLPSDALVIGVDVARFGDDESAIKVRRGRDARTVPALYFRGVDTMQLVGHLVALITRLGGAAVVDAIFIDETGIGGAVIDRMRQLGYRVIGVNNGAKSDAPTTEPAANKAAECWSRMREWLGTGGAIEDEDQLCMQLESRMYGYDAHNRVTLERKDDMKKRGLSSPDRAEALAYTFAYPVAARSDLGYGAARGAGVVSEYDPMAEMRSR